MQSHLFHGIDANFWGLTNPTLASEMPVPQKYYVARRMREFYRPRLEAAGLWSLPSAEEEQRGPFDKDKTKKPDYKATMTRAFEREKVPQQWIVVTFPDCVYRFWIKQRQCLRYTRTTWTENSSFSEIGKLLSFAYAALDSDSHS